MKTIIALLFTFILASVLNGQGKNSVKLPDSPISLTVKLLDLKDNEFQLELELRNDGLEAIFIATEPVQENGRRGYYVSTDAIDGTLIGIGSRVFRPAFPRPYSDSTRVRLKRLAPGQKHRETIKLKWPLLETVPPVDPYIDPKRINRQAVAMICVSIGYFVDAHGHIEDFVKKHPYIRGIEQLDLGVSGHRRFYEIQKLAFAKIAVPKTLDAQKPRI